MSVAPMVLIDGSSGAPARLYRQPRSIICVQDVSEIPAALDGMRAALADGGHLAGYLAYEAGTALQPKPLVPRSSTLPVVWFGVFDAPALLDDVDVRRWLPEPADVTIWPVRPRVSFARYAQAFERVHDLIRAGDIYQANLTMRADVAIEGDPMAVYARLRDRAGASHAAFIATGEDTILSLSPELFFRRDGARLTARPMKGTAPRSPDPAEDRRLSDGLAIDPKQRAENLMIVDLLRNDLSRVARPGSVRVPRLFEVETYPTVHQMTSTVEAMLLAGRDTIDVIAATFPCGSITGAPKVRAMEIIDEVEPEARGIYCGSIGWIEPGGDAAFNVAIRTLHLAAGADVATLGLGSAVVADSDAESEWDECLTKARFLSGG